ncbi:MAG: hypothetical protein IT259_18130 [Saprospiraceae bacterium]|nr:hypothetical protein [Saprospiraceae bacterium]
MDALVQDPLFYWLAWAIATLIGLVVGWSLRAALYEKPILEAYERSEQDRNALARLYSQVRDQHDLKEADLKRMSLEIGQMRQQLSAFEIERATWTASAQAEAAKLAKAQAEAAFYAEKIQFLDAPLGNLRSRNAEHGKEIARLHEELNAWKVLNRDFNGMLRQVRTLEETTSALEAERSQLQQQLDAARIEIENLQLEVLRKRSYSEFSEKAATASAPTSRNILAGPAQAAGRQGQSDGDHADDLKIINGIMPFAEQQLYALGIYTFAQISQWDDATVAAVAEALGLSPRQIIEEDWVGQARHLMAGPPKVQS